MDECKFCKLLKGEIPSWIVYEEKNVVALLPKEIEVYGHTLVIPRNHYADLYDIPNEILSDLIRVSKMLALVYILN